MSTWDEPASACLSSRIPYHSEVTEEKLRTIDAAERVLRDLGFRVCRVRHHDTIARLELGRDEIARALEPEIAATIDRELRALGYAHVTIDLRGYRLGSLNEALKLRPVECTRQRIGRRRAGADFPRRPPRAACPGRSRISTPSTSRSASGTSTSRSTSRIRPAIRSTSRWRKSRPRCCAPRASTRRRRAGWRSGARWPAPRPFPALLFFRRLEGRAAVALMGDARRSPLSPLFWFTALRPLSDMPGLRRGDVGAGAAGRTAVPPRA